MQIVFMEFLVIDPEKRLTLSEISDVISKGKKIKLSDNAVKAVSECRKFLEDKINKSVAPIYGINTGFGSLCNVRIPDSDLEKLQENLVMSHACGTGDEVDPAIVKLMLLLKVQGLSYGKSGVMPETIERLVYFFNEDIIPVVYEQGSLGASGDLAPLAHLCLPLIGFGEVIHKGERVSAKELHSKLKLKPLRLKSKEGLALLNGTQFMSAYGTWCCLHARQIVKQADFIGAISLEGFDGRIEPFVSHLHTIRPHKGQIETARNIFKLLNESDLIHTEKQHVQDPYSFRCMPQVHGASRDAISYACSVIETEINSVTDNPTIFPEHDEVLSGGNFHGQPLALALDFLAMALAELGSISERRVYLLVSGQRGLPPFLVKNPGLNSGFMIPQYTAASIVSQSKQFCTPASIDSIVSSNGQEDHVSMGANAATKCKRVALNVRRVLAIELFTATQALEFRRPKKSSPEIEKLVGEFRKKVSFVNEDKIMYSEMKTSEEFLYSWKD